MKNWKETTLGDVADIIGGGTPKTSVDEYWNGNVPWLSVADFNNDIRWVYRTEKTITQTGLENSSTRLLNAGDLIISARGTVGAFAQLKVPMTLNQSCYGLRAKKETSNDFLYYLLKFSIPQVQKNVRGAVFDTITRDTFDQIKILLPPIEEQKEITSVLGSLDDKIELLREENKTLEATAQTIFKEWFVNFNFPNAEGKPYQSSGGKMIDSELGLIPSGWRVGRIKDLVNIYSGFAFSSTDFVQDSEYKLVTIKNVQDRQFDQNTKDGINSIPSKMPAYCHLKTGDILLSLTGNVGRICLVIGEKYLLNQRVAKLEAINKKDYAFSYLLFLQEAIFSLLQNISSGTAQQNLSPIQTKEIEIVVPNKDILDAFGNIANPMIEKINQNNSEIQTLSTLRDTLLPKLMNGEV